MLVICLRFPSQHFAFSSALLCLLPRTDFSLLTYSVPSLPPVCLFACQPVHLVQPPFDRSSVTLHLRSWFSSVVLCAAQYYRLCSSQLWHRVRTHWYVNNFSYSSTVLFSWPRSLCGQSSSHPMSCRLHHSSSPRSSHSARPTCPCPPVACSCSWPASPLQRYCYPSALHLRRLIV